MKLYLVLQGISSHEDVKLISELDNPNAYSTFSEETSVEDEGVITSFNEDYLEESDEDDYFELEGIIDPQQTSPRRVHLVRDTELGLGLSIQGGSDYSLPVIVSAVRADSPADHSGLVYVGDQVMAINEVNLDETTCHKDALRLLTQCGDRVCLGMYSSLPHLIHSILVSSKSTCCFRDNLTCSFICKNQR